MYSLSRMRAASPERNFTPSDSDFYSPPYSLASFSDKSFPMNSPISPVPPPPPRKDSYTVTQELWSYYDENVTHSYPRDSSRNERLNSNRSSLNPKRTSPPPLPPKSITVRSVHDSKKPKPLPKPVLGSGVFMKKSSSSSFSVASSRPPNRRIGPTGEIQKMQTKQSYSQLGEEIKNTVNLMSDNTKESLISYLAECLQPRGTDSNDNKTSPALYQPPSKDSSHHSSNYARSGTKVQTENVEFTVSPIYQRIEETGENLPPETGFNRSDKKYHSMTNHSTPSQLRNTQRASKHIPENENIANFYEEEKKANSDQKKYRFGKFRSSKKVVRTNPVYESSSVLQGLPGNTSVPTVNQISKPNVYTSSSIPSSSHSLHPSSSENEHPDSRIRLRSPVVSQKETMDPNLDNHLVDQSQKLWLHPVNKLTSGSICYTVRYMGTAVVSSLVGKETINDTCRRIKEVSKRGKKIPSIILSISWKWIKLYGIEKEYMEDLRMFAFISRDKKNPKYFCTVFQSPTIEHADEVVHTLGQAFEISYQQLLNAKNAQKTKNKPPKANKTVTQLNSNPLRFYRSQSADDVL